MRAASWVVYKMTVNGRLAGPNAVCEQSEWDEMQRHSPGRHVLVREGVANEGEAERLARGRTVPAAGKKAVRF